LYPAISAKTCTKHLSPMIQSQLLSSEPRDSIKRTKKNQVPIKIDTLFIRAQPTNTHHFFAYDIDLNVTNNTYLKNNHCNIYRRYHRHSSAHDN
ncbi:TPA: hypothetical protein ACPHRZ_001690, partial [Vibrio antiquarius]